MHHLFPKIRLGFLNWKSKRFGKVHSINEAELKALYIPALAIEVDFFKLLSKNLKKAKIPWFPKLQHCCLVEVVHLWPLLVELPWVPPFLEGQDWAPHLRIKAVSVVPLSFLSRKRSGKILTILQKKKKMFFDLQSCLPWRFDQY